MNPNEIHGRRDGAEGGMSVLGFANVLLRRWRIVAGVTGAALAVALLVVLTTPTRYAARSRISVESGEQPTMSSPAQLLFGAMGRSPNLELFAEIARSREVLWELVRGDIAYAPTPDADTVAGAVPELLGVEGATPEDRQAAAVSVLEGAVDVSANPVTGLIEVRTTAPSRGLAVALNERLTAIVNRVHLERRQHQAAQERAFIQGRLADTRDELRAAEEEVQAFLENNRRFRESPSLVTEYERLNRNVNLKSEIYIELARSLEQTRIREVRNTPVVTVVDRPQYYVGRIRESTRTLLIGLLAGLFTGVAAAFLVEYAGRLPGRFPEDYRELRRLLGRFPPFRRGAPPPGPAPGSPPLEDLPSRQETTGWTTAGRS